MEDREWLEAGLPKVGWVEAELQALGRPTILLVEDEDDIRDLLVTLMDLAGFAAHPCRTAEEGLEQLREQHFDLVLTDYMLPKRTGTWLLKQAADEGLLDATPALVVTAHSNPRGAEGFEIIQKPFDLDHLVDRVRRRLEKSGGSDAPKRPSRAVKNGSAGSSGSTGSGGDHQDDCPDPIELILYVSTESPRSATAIEQIKNVLSQHTSLRVKLTICDLSKEPEGGNADGIAFRPALVKRSPGPKTFILGHITNPELLLEMLQGCEEH
jgi:CheY-like chemotaxis protein